jgi:MFS family permease
MLLALRGLVAVGEGTYYPAATALISDWHRPEMRSRALSVHQTAVFAGAGIGAYTAAVLGDMFGWRIPFVVFGALGLIVCIGLWKWLRDAPVRIVKAAAAASSKPLHTVLRCGPAMILCVVFFLATGVTWGVGVWAPTYVHDRLGLDLASSAFYGNVTVNVAGFLCVPVGGLLADWLAKRTPLGRFYTLAIGLCVAGALLLPLDFVHTAQGVGLVLLASSAGKGLFDGCIYAAVHDVVPREARATAVGLLTMLGFIGAGLAPIFVARVSEGFGMAMGLASLAFFYLLAVGLLLATRAPTRRAVSAIRLTEETAATSAA